MLVCSSVLFALVVVLLAYSLAHSSIALEDEKTMRAQLSVIAAGKQERIALSEKILLLTTQQSQGGDVLNFDANMDEDVPAPGGWDESESGDTPPYFVFETNSGRQVAHRGSSMYDQILSGM